MKQIFTLLRKSIFIAVCILSSALASAQCSVTGTPTFSHSCSVEYYETINATGTGITSTISLVGGTCSGTTTYFNDYTTQGITASTGSSVAVNITRATGYTAYLTIYIDWNNNGIYETTELAGSMVTLSTSTAGATYNFTVPSTGVVTGTNLHMRMMLSEVTTGAPCTGNYGQAYDYYFIVGSGCTPVLSFAPSSHDTICGGESGLNISVTGAGSGGAYTWSPSAGLTASTGSMVNANPLTTTIYSVTGTTSGGCSATYYDTITVLTGAAPVDTVISAGSDKICPGDSVLLNGSTGTGYVYQWFSGGIAIPGATSHSYEAVAGGTYMLQITNSFGCSSSSSAVAVTVYPAPIPVITFNGKVFHTGNFYSSYQWYENGTVITGATTDSLIAHSNGSYTLKVTDSNGCTATTSPFALTGLGVDNITGTQGFEIYPNPAGDVLHIVSPILATTRISSIEGKTILEQNNAREIDIHSLTPGIYFISLFDENGHRLTVRRLIKN